MLPTTTVLKCGSWSIVWSRSKSPPVVTIGRRGCNGRASLSSTRRKNMRHAPSWRMFFRRVELSEARPLHTRLPIVTTGGDLLLLHTILHDPHFRTVVVGSITNDHDLEDGIIGGEIEFVVELSHQGAKLFEEGDADGLQVRLAFAGSGLVTGIGAGDTLKIAVQPNGLGVGGNAPFRSSEKDADVRSVEVHHARRDGISLHGLIDGREDDDVLCHVNDGTAAGEIGDYFVFVLLLGKSVNRGRVEDPAQEKERDSPRKSRAEARRNPPAASRHDTPGLRR